MVKKEKDDETLLNKTDREDKSFKTNDTQLTRIRSLNQEVNERLWVYYSVFALIGLVTNTGLVMVGSAAEGLAATFHKESLMPMFQLSEILFASLIQFINCWLLININHVTRLTFNAFYMLSAYLLITVVTIWEFEAGFWIALFAALMHGTSAALSESTVLGYMKGFPSRLVAPFSTGTGFAGIFGSGVLLVLKIFFEKDGYIFAIVSPIIIVYLACIFYLRRQKRRFRFDMIEDQSQAHGTRSLENDRVDPFISPLSKKLSSSMESATMEQRTKPLESSLQSEEIILEFDGENSGNKNAPKKKTKKHTNSNMQEIPEGESESEDDNNIENESALNEAFSIAALGRIFKHVGVYLFCLSTIYLFEYTILT